MYTKIILTSDLTSCQFTLIEAIYENLADFLRTWGASEVFSDH